MECVLSTAAISIFAAEDVLSFDDHFRKSTFLRFILSRNQFHLNNSHLKGGLSTIQHDTIS